MAEPKRTNRSSLRSGLGFLLDKSVSVPVLEVSDFLEGWHQELWINWPTLPRNHHAAPAVVADNLVLEVDQSNDFLDLGYFAYIRQDDATCELLGWNQCLSHFRQRLCIGLNLNLNVFGFLLRFGTTLGLNAFRQSLNI
jgi:hypothetical protein